MQFVLRVGKITFGETVDLSSVVQYGSLLIRPRHPGMNYPLTPMSVGDPATKSNNIFIRAGLFCLSLFIVVVVDRSADGVMWMGDTLARALTTVNERQRGDGSGSGGGATTNQPADPESSSQDGEGGLRGVCRALFHHCVQAIGFVSPSGLTAEAGLAVSLVGLVRILVRAVASYSTAVPIGCQPQIT